jgi:phospholipid/cholesterol/gamma-HCH transport system substrate-binding protein
LPSQKQLKWSQLRVGITVIFASIVLILLLFLMSNTGGVFTRRITLYSYFDNAQGLRQGAPVRLSGVDIGNVTKIIITHQKDKQLTPVEVTMKVTTKYGFDLRRDSTVALETAGVLGETYLDIDSSQAIGAPAENGDALPTQVHPDFNEVVRSSESTLQQINALLRRADRILAFAESGKGSLGKLIYDPTLYDRLSKTVSDFQQVVDEVAKGQGSLGQLINSNDAYNKFVGTLDKVNAVIDDIQAGKGTAGKFLKDPSLYNNANDTVANLKQVSADLQAGKGTAGRLLKDEELADKINTTMTKLAAITSDLEAGRGSAGKFLKDDSFYNNTNQLVVDMRDFVKAFRENPKKYLSIKLHIF